ncbi:hypothetical protein AN640_01150 [Candidatus Epulonipiscium fishelsonii]|uniref:Uncharacterized protein n=1 Tax=Candidatus Epulonipiscium fishelsonii TaxID=77094 RepID=A0ACC8XI75_9FIRM|nr:hypothetical protein AN640_01150 [Epulopiscium sp. SCG-D08WGA-EpuloA1]OON91124.1 MAG: hypothetical protein ATN32_02490 [Epulopiscium sp. AS2M-Bin002]
MFYKYPQIKAINYFNNSLPWENSFALYDNDILLETYNALVSDELFIKEYGQTAPIGYKNITNGGIELGSDIELSVSAYYPYANNVNEISVKYWLDDMLLSEVTQSPYTINLAQDELAGKLELKVEMIVNGEIKQTQTINLMHN